MKTRLIIFLFSCFLLTLFPNVNIAQTSLEQRLLKHVYTLASDTLYGREAGTQYAHIAADYILGQFKEIGVSSYNEAGSYYQFFDINTMKGPASLGYKNIVGLIEGNDSVLKNEYIVVGAHYDHLGFKESEDGAIIIYNGADDNASGVATLIELARNLKAKQSQLKRSVLFIAFDAEEMGLYGSQHYVTYPTVPIGNIKMMFSIDMVGWYSASGKVEYEGTGTLSGGNMLIKNPAIVPNGLNIVTKKFEKSIFTATDTEPFAKRGIPTFAVTTGTKSPYHKPEDDANLIDYKGMELITEHLTSIVLTASQNSKFHSSGKVASKHRVSNRLVTFGVTASIGSNHHHYTAGAINGKGLTSYSIGLQTQFNGKWFGIRPEILYEYMGAKHPAGNIRTDNLTIPLSFVIQTPEYDLVGANVFIGGYYSHRFNGKQGGDKLDFVNDFYRNEAGWSYGFGIKISKIRLSYTKRYGLTNITRIKNPDNAHIRNRVGYFSITYIF